MCLHKKRIEISYDFSNMSNFWTVITSWEKSYIPYIYQVHLTKTWLASKLTFFAKEKGNLIFLKSFHL